MVPVNPRLARCLDDDVADVLQDFAARSRQVSLPKYDSSPMLRPSRFQRYRGMKLPRLAVAIPDVLYCYRCGSGSQHPAAQHLSARYRLPVIARLRSR